MSRRLKCPHCPQTRSNEDELERHVRTHVKDLADFAEEIGE